NDDIQPQITNCIVWGNSYSIYTDEGNLNNVRYSNVEDGFSGQGNINHDPAFTNDSTHKYNIAGWSYCINSGIQDTTGLNIANMDFKDEARIYGHSVSNFDRIDIGAYEYQGFLKPSGMSASDGEIDYPGYIQLFWDFNPDYNIQPNGFRIYRNGTNLYSVDSSTFSYSDNEVIPGIIYTYSVQAYNGSESSYSNEDAGYIKPNGIISGNVKTTNNNPVAGVKISLSPSSGYSLQMDESQSSQLEISNPDIDLNQNFTFETWIKTSDQEALIFTNGTHSLGIVPSGVIYSDGVNTLSQQDIAVDVSNNEWHHIAIINNYTDSYVEMFLDGSNVATDSTYIFGNYVGSDTMVSSGWTGFIDDIRIWSSARDSVQINETMNIVLPYNAEGLVGYWALNEGSGAIAYDATNNSNNATATQCFWSSDEPGLELGSITDNWGDYVITQIPYGNATTFTVTPTKTGHMFQPEQRLVTLSSSNIAANEVNFTDNSMIEISGNVIYNGTVCPVEGASILLNGSAIIPPVLTDEDGNYVLEVEHGTNCLVSASFNGHPFNREWNLGSVTFPRSNINFENMQRSRIQLEVVGGDSGWVIGDFDVNMESENGLYSRSIVGQTWDTGSLIVQNLPPLEFNVTVNPTDNDPFDLVVDEQFQSLKTSYLDLRDSGDSLDTLRYVWKAPLQIETIWADSLELKQFSDYPDNYFYVLTQNEWYEVSVRAIEDYSYAGHENQITYLDDCSIQINDEIGGLGLIEDAFADTTQYIYRFAPYLPNINGGYARQYQNIIEFTVIDEDLNRFATQSDWAITEGVRPLESTFATTSPEIPFLVLHDPPGDCSYSSFNSSSSHSVNLSVGVTKNGSDTRFVNIHLGPDISFEEGCSFYNINTEIDVIADLSYQWTVEKQQERSKEQLYTFTTSEEYRTADSDDIIGDFGGDVFVGGAVNLVWGVTRVLNWDDENDNVTLTPDVMVSPDGFATRYIYTESQIQNTVIPNLLAINDTTSAAMWQSYLDMNEYNKEHAVSNPN
ncbi:MAG: LamG domain-containing protein, partial [Candidatus Cloacimonetes bacterium]|nr:LamG domain-containing protein [Candidatus Cloacimonadota bacterium]